MSKDTLYRYACENCATAVIAEEVPKGWVRILSTGRSSGSGGDVHHHSLPPAFWSPRTLVHFPEDAYWCSPSCLKVWVGTQAERVVDDAKLR